MKRRDFLSGLGCLAASGLPMQAVASPAHALLGGGASVPHPIYNAWSDAIGADLNINLAYLPVGSGSGVRMSIAREVDFGGTDVPISPEQAAANQLVQLPTVLASLVFAVNLPDPVSQALRLDRQTLRRIFDGDIRNWSDQRIATLNPDIDLPNLAITPVVRRDSSGSTSLAGNYLLNGSEGDPRFMESAPGVSVNGPRAIALTIKRLYGSIGYIETSTAAVHKLRPIMLETAPGRFVAQSRESMSLAALALGDGEDTEDFGNSWPIVSPTYILIPHEDEVLAQSRVVAEFFRAALDFGEDLAWQTGFIPLPPQLKADALRHLDQFAK